jgi:hypothetical protein
VPPRLIKSPASRAPQICFQPPLGCPSVGLARLVCGPTASPDRRAAGCAPSARHPSAPHRQSNQPNRCKRRDDSTVCIPLPSANKLQVVHNGRTCETIIAAAAAATPALTAPRPHVRPFLARYNMASLPCTPATSSYFFSPLFTGSHMPEQTVLSPSQRSPKHLPPLTLRAYQLRFLADILCRGVSHFSPLDIGNTLPLYCTACPGSVL